MVFAVEFRVLIPFSVTLQIISMLDKQTVVVVLDPFKRYVVFKRKLLTTNTAIKTIIITYNFPKKHPEL